VDNEMSHPADGEAWKHFDRKYPSFAADARNLRLAVVQEACKYSHACSHGCRNNEKISFLWS